MNFAYEYDSRGNIVQENRNGKVTTYTYDALGQLIRVNDPDDPTAGEGGTTWVYEYDRGGNILSKSYYSYTTGTPGVAHDTILYSYMDSNWKDKLTTYDGQTITYDAIGNPLDDGRRRYEWQAGRQLKKVYVKADLKEGTKPGVDEQSGTVLKITWSNGNLLDAEVTSTQASATVTRCGVDVTEEYPASAFNWVRDSGDVEADNAWNTAHAGMKSIACTATNLNREVKISCTLTASSATYGSIMVDNDMDASHTPAELDANDIFVIEDGYLKVTTSRGNVYALEDGNVKAAGAKLNGTITAETKLFATQPEDIVEFSYDHNKLRTQKKVTKADGTVETTDYTLHGKLIAYMARGNDKMHFFYDGQSRPSMVEFNGTLYSYVHNLQGDIIGILDSAGSLVVEYKYDAWGKPVPVRTLTTEYEVLAELNPFRYRGYVYDEETGLYYLRSRYYDSQLCRMLNVDAFIFLRRICGNNLFTYCVNVPTMLEDSNGKFFEEAVMQMIHKAVNTVIEALQITISEVECYENYTEMTVHVIRKTGFYTTEYNTYYLELATSAQRSEYFKQKDIVESDWGGTFSGAIVGWGAGYVIGAGLDKIFSTVNGGLTSIAGSLIVSAVSYIFSKAEDELNNSLVTLYADMEQGDSPNGIAYVERIYYTNTEGLGTSPIVTEMYYTEWEESEFLALFR